MKQLGINLIAGNNMNAETLECFLAGLKIIIGRSGLSQRKWCAGVTTPENLSKILNQRVGTTYEMREALAERAGMEVSEIVNLGKPAEIRPALETKAASYPVWTEGELEGMSKADLLAEVVEYSQYVSEMFSRSARLVGTRAARIAAERNRLLDLCNDKAVILNSINEAIKVVERKDKIISYCNRANRERNKQDVGDSCETKDCMLDGECLAERAFASGETERALVVVDSVTFGRVAYPVLGPLGTVDRVVIVSRIIDEFMDMMVNMGWKRPEEG